MNVAHSQSVPGTPLAAENPTPVTALSAGPMFEDRSYKRTFYSAPQSVESLVAAPWSLG